MTEMLRRLFWRIPLIIFSTILLFAFFAQLPATKSRLKGPLFFNPTPLNAQTAALDAVERLLAGDPRAEGELLQLGGAALPTILPRLASYPIDERRRIAVALYPLAKRMGLSESDLFLTMRGLGEGGDSYRPNADEAILFWEKFQEDRALDFKPAAVKRLVGRLAQGRLSLRRVDLLSVDTFALPVLVSSLGSVENEDDVLRVGRIATLITHILGHDFELSDRADIAEARARATAIRKYWDRKGPRFTSMSQLELKLGSLSQTEFGIWIRRSTRALVGTDDAEVFEHVGLFALVSLPLLLIAALTSAILAPLIVGVSQTIALGREKLKLGFGVRVGWSFGLAAALALLLRPSEYLFFREELLVAIVATTWTAYVLQREVADRIDWRAHQVLKNRALHQRVYAVARWIAPTLPTFAPLFASQWVVWVVCAEFTGGRDGWGYRTMMALKSGDISWLMASSLGLVVGALLVQMLSDVALGRPMLKGGAR